MIDPAMVPAPTPEDDYQPIPGQIDLFTGKEHPHETERTPPRPGTMAGDPIAFPFPDSPRAEHAEWIRTRRAS